MLMKQLWLDAATKLLDGQLLKTGSDFTMLSKGPILMPPKLASNPQVWRLAKDLGLRPAGDPVDAIVKFAHRQVRSFLDGISCNTLTELLRIVAAKVDTLFVEIHDDRELFAVKDRYLREGELAFADLESQLSRNVYAITFRRTAGKPSDRRFISVIDCRGEKAARSYFSKWHEIAQLLTLTSQQRLKFFRTHELAEVKDPEEVVMDKIAGDIGFFQEIVSRHITSPLSFSKISHLRTCLCPEASGQASLIGFVHACHEPCLLVEAELAWKKGDARRFTQGDLEFSEPPPAALRAVRITPNNAARRSELFIPVNMRIPVESVIARVFREDLPELKADENMSWWRASDGLQLPDRSVHVLAKRAGHRVQALITIH